MGQNMSKCQNLVSNSDTLSSPSFLNCPYYLILNLLNPYRMQKPNQFRADYCQDGHFHEVCLFSASFTSIIG